MNQEVYDYRATEEIKRIAIGIQELRCRKSLEREPYLKGAASRVNWVKEAENRARYELLEHISDFILVRETEDGRYLDAELHLPYVRDSKVKELEDLAYFWEKSSNKYQKEVAELCKKIHLLERPWYKKLWAKVRP